VQVDNVRYHIGFPAFILNATALSDYYKHLVILANMTHFSIIEAVMNWSRAEDFERLFKPFDKDAWEISPAEVNAYYTPESNAISGFYIHRD